MKKCFFIYFLLFSSVFSTYSQKFRGISSIIEIREMFYDQPLVLLDSNWICFDPQVFPMDEKRFFYISYQFQKEIINKQLVTEDSCILILRKDLFTIDGVSVEIDSAKNFALYYYNSERQISEKLSGMRLNLEENQYYVDEIISYLTMPSFKGKTDDQILRVLSNLWKYSHGFIDERSLKSLLWQAKKD